MHIKHSTFTYYKLKKLHSDSINFVNIKKLDEISTCSNVYHIISFCISYHTVLYIISHHAVHRITPCCISYHIVPYVSYNITIRYRIARRFLSYSFISYCIVRYHIVSRPIIVRDHITSHDTIIARARVVLYDGIEYYRPRTCIYLYYKSDIVDIVLQTILVGDSGVGKTSLLVQFDLGKFQSGSFAATVGIGFTVSCRRPLRHLLPRFI